MLGTSPGASHLSAEVLIAPAQFAYMQIPASELRGFVDSLAPGLSVNRFADVSSGWGHRYRAGHDLFIDVPATFQAEGFQEGFKHAGHIILTDFPTRAGIPIPGFSQSGLGQLLEQFGISNGWLQLSLFDTGVGVLAISGGAGKLVQAVEGSLNMDFSTALQTFGVGTVELTLGFSHQNPLLVAGGIENILAGVISTWQTYSVYVSPLDFLGAAGFSAILGFGVAYGLIGEKPIYAAKDAVRSGVVGALFSVSPAFGFGAFAGLLVCRSGSVLAERQNQSLAARLTVDRVALAELYAALVTSDPEVMSVLERTAPCLVRDTSVDITRSPLQPHGWASAPMLQSDPHGIPVRWDSPRPSFSYRSWPAISLSMDADALCDEFRVLCQCHKTLLA